MPPPVMGPGVGDPAPDERLLGIGGREVWLSSFWGTGPAVVVFLRYFGCPFCQAQVVQLREDRELFEEARARIVLIGHGSHEEATAFSDRMHQPFACLCDPSLHAYRAYGLGRATLLQVFGPKVAGPFLKNNLHQETRQRGLHGGVFMQMPGTFVVDGAGVIRLAHRNRHVADTPGNQTVLGVINRLKATA